MSKRLNAGLGMAQITNLVNEIAIEHGPNAVGAVGHCEIFPNSTNIIPGKAVVDFRSPDAEVIKVMDGKLKSGGSKIADQLGLGVDFEVAGALDPVEFDPVCVSQIRAAAKTWLHSKGSHLWRGS